MAKPPSRAGLKPGFIGCEGYLVFTDTASPSRDMAVMRLQTLAGKFDELDALSFPLVSFVGCAVAVTIALSLQV